MTFGHGDYARMEAIKTPQAIAEKLYKKALQCHEDHRAFLGLGMLFQQQRKIGDAIKIVEKGLALFPGSFDLVLCQAINHMNAGDYKMALELLEPYQDRPETKTYTSACLEALGLSTE